MYEMDNRNKQAAMKKIANDILKNEESDETTEELDTQPPEKKARFQQLNQEELDQLAKKRTEATTDRQTVWAVKIFKGREAIFFFTIAFNGLDRVRRHRDRKK